MAQEAVAQAPVLRSPTDEARNVSHRQRGGVGVLQHAQLWPQGGEGVVSHLSARRTVTH